MVERIIRSGYWTTISMRARLMRMILVARRITGRLKRRTELAVRMRLNFEGLG